MNSKLVNVKIFFIVIGISICSRCLLELKPEKTYINNDSFRSKPIKPKNTNFLSSLLKIRSINRIIIIVLRNCFVKYKTPKVKNTRERPFFELNTSYNKTAEKKLTTPSLISEFVNINCVHLLLKIIAEKIVNIKRPIP